MSAGSRRAGGDAGLEQIQRQYPQWLIWRGSFTGDYWAMPPRGHPTRQELISARDLDELAQRLAETEEQYDLLGHLVRPGMRLALAARLPTAASTRAERTVMVDMEVIVRRQDRGHCASITCMIRRYVARRAKVIEDHPHNAASRAREVTRGCSRSRGLPRSRCGAGSWLGQLIVSGSSASAKVPGQAGSIRAAALGIWCACRRAVGSVCGGP